jgi:hypothetical protein
MGKVGLRLDLAPYGAVPRGPGTLMALSAGARNRSLNPIQIDGLTAVVDDVVIGVKSRLPLPSIDHYGERLIRSNECNR